MVLPATARAETAEEEASRALTLYRAERYVEAARHFLRAYDLSGNPTQLHNAAKALEKGEFLSQAQVQWERYAVLEDIPANKRAQAEVRIEAIRRSLKARRKARQRNAEKAPPAPPDVVTARPPPESNAVARYTVAGIGAATLLGGAGLYLSGWVTYWRFDDTKETKQEVTRGQANAAKLRSGIGIGVAAAGALTIAGAFLFLQDEPPTVALVPAPGGMSLAGCF